MGNNGKKLKNDSKNAVAEAAVITAPTQPTPTPAELESQKIRGLVAALPEKVRQQMIADSISIRLGHDHVMRITPDGPALFNCQNPDTPYQLEEILQLIPNLNLVWPYQSLLRITDTIAYAVEATDLITSWWLVIEAEKREAIIERKLKLCLGGQIDLPLTKDGVGKLNSHLMKNAFRDDCPVIPLEGLKMAWDKMMADLLLKARPFSQQRGDQYKRLGRLVTDEHRALPIKAKVLQQRLNELIAELAGQKEIVLLMEASHWHMHVGPVIVAAVCGKLNATDFCCPMMPSAGNRQLGLIDEGVPETGQTEGLESACFAMAARGWSPDKLEQVWTEALVEMQTSGSIQSAWL